MKKNNKHTLVIDGNYFLFRTLHVIPHLNKSKPLLYSKDETRAFIAKLATDFSYQIRLFEGLLDKIVWTTDSRSWRKDFYPDADYKGNRKQDGNINWENFSKASDDFISILRKKGVIISKIDGAEGDDLMYAWNTESMANNKSVIMFTGDRDIVQLVNKSINDSYTILFSPAHKKLYTFQGFSNWLNTDEVVDETDLFAMLKVSTSTENQCKKLLKDLINKKKVSILEIDPEEFRFIKILTGDAGDNVNPAYWYNSNGRRYGISANKASQIVSEFKEKHGMLSHMYLFNDELIKDLANITIRVMKAKHMSREQIIINIKSNVNLMVLSAESIPEGILDDMLRSVEADLNSTQIDLKEITSMKLLLDGTEYQSASDDIVISSKIFKDDELTDFSFIKDRKKQNKIF